MSEKSFSKLKNVFSEHRRSMLHRRKAQLIQLAFEKDLTHKFTSEWKDMLMRRFSSEKRRLPLEDREGGRTALNPLKSAFSPSVNKASPCLNRSALCGLACCHDEQKKAALKPGRMPTFTPGSAARWRFYRPRRRFFWTSGREPLN
ncbi:unnamed protein product [Arctogadus glacialis]